MSLVAKPVKICRSSNMFVIDIYSEVKVQLGVIKQHETLNSKCGFHACWEVMNHQLISLF